MLGVWTPLGHTSTRCIPMAALIHSLTSPWVSMLIKALPFTVLWENSYIYLGSGSLAAMATFEDRYRPDMEVYLGDVVGGLLSILHSLSSVMKL